MKNLTKLALVVAASALGYGSLLFWADRAGILGVDSLVAIDESALYPVMSVIDGDTFKARVGPATGAESAQQAQEITVRVLGIDTPETVDPRRPVGCYGPEASDEAKSLLAGRRVRLAYNPDREKTDKYGRYLMYVYRDDGLFYNRFMVEEGYAREYTFGAPYAYQTEFRAAQKAAKAAKKGLWGACAPGAASALSASATSPADTNRYPRSP